MLNNTVIARVAHRRGRRAALLVLAGAAAGALLLGAPPAAGQELGLAAGFPEDLGIESHPDVLYFLDFDDQAETLAWANGQTGYGWTDDPAHVLSGGGALEIQQLAGTHVPSEIHPEIDDSDVAYVRWYRKWEVGYDFTQHKMSGVYARAPGEPEGTAGIPPDGYDKYSCKLFVSFSRNPRFYTYHPEQAGAYGDELPMNLVTPEMELEADRWYCFEMMLKANTAGVHDGELKMWIDGVLVAHYSDMRFRDTNDLKINELTYSAYVGGTWVSERDQKLWDDQLVVARSYIGPLVRPSDGGTPDGGPTAADGGAAVQDGGVVGAADGSLGDAGDDASGNGQDPRATASLGGDCGCRFPGRGSHGVLGLLLLVTAVARRQRARRPR